MPSSGLGFCHGFCPGVAQPAASLASPDAAIQVSAAFDALVGLNCHAKNKPLPRLAGHLLDKLYGSETRCLEIDSGAPFAYHAWGRTMVAARLCPHGMIQFRPQDDHSTEEEGMDTVTIDRLSTEPQFRQMLDLFEEVFHDPENYGPATRPSAPYVQSMLSNPDFIGLLATDGEAHALGALAAYVLRKFEQERSEIYLYDLAVSADARRRGVATALIDRLKQIAREIGAWVVFVQADKGEEDGPAQALYRKLGTEEDVFHYDLRL